MRLWRISRYPLAARAFDGEGARLYPGRWNPAGVRAVYASSSLALAALEILVHAEIHHLKLTYYSYSIDVPDRLVEEPDLADLPPDWDNIRGPRNARAFGGAWAASLRSLALLVPSIVIPQEKNAVLNPLHPRFARVRIGDPTPYSFDRRLGPLKASPPPARRRRRHPK
jgi:RES domain-containing protein